MSSGSLKPKGDTTMSTMMKTMMKTMLVGALLVGLAPLADAAQAGRQSKQHRQQTYEVTAPNWSQGATSAYAQRPGRRPAFHDDPPGSAFQDQGVRNELYSGL